MAAENEMGLKGPYDVDRKSETRPIKTLVT